MGRILLPKVLLLGAGESGKSTFGKQLKLLNKGTISEKEKTMYRKGERTGRVILLTGHLPSGGTQRTNGRRTPIATFDLV